ncbi:hypothetical protein [Paenibacillus dakarensis]|uniref:hypothetical protein n=1 Tax=Paenibacillus dakarensis TaxID=1527293 RepID=UPI0006D56EF7|nr:hypothetical protein [Paenibacillus dakarensis]
MPDQDEVNAQLQTLAAEFTRLSAAAIADETRMKLLEETQKRHDDDIRELKVTTGAIKEHYTQIILRFDSLETKLFSLVQQSHTDSTKERSANQRAWISLIKFVLTGTIFALVTYAVTKGGG